MVSKQESKYEIMRIYNKYENLFVESKPYVSKMVEEIINYIIVETVPKSKYNKLLNIKNNLSKKNYIINKEANKYKSIYKLIKRNFDKKVGEKNE
jgi:hypothetical protein